MKYRINDYVVFSRAPEGPLASQVSAFANWACDQGYARYSTYRKALLAACFSEWLARKGIGVEDVTLAHPAQFLRHRARRLFISRGDAPGLRQFIAFLQREGVIAPASQQDCRTTPVEACLETFAGYLREERALATSTIANYVSFIRSLLKQRFASGPICLGELCASDVVGFVQCQAAKLSAKRAQLLTTALRSFLQFARYRGEITLDLASAVPTVANWTMASIPRAIAREEVNKLLAGIDRCTTVGCRDYAILLLLARLGLRASQIVSLELDDIDWAAGSLRVHGKSARSIELPLPAEVGEAIVDYLQRGRPKSPCRRVFLRAQAPIRGFASESAISSIVRHAIERLDIDAPTHGAHQFRHALATDMLRQGAALSEIAELLGHRSVHTTSIYAKVDVDALRSLALPWPGGAQ